MVSENSEDTGVGKVTRYATSPSEKRAHFHARCGVQCGALPWHHSHVIRKSRFLALSRKFGSKAQTRTG